MLYTPSGMWSCGTEDSSVNTDPDLVMEVGAWLENSLAGESSVKCGLSVSGLLPDMESSSSTFSMACHTCNRENGVS